MNAKWCRLSGVVVLVSACGGDDTTAATSNAGGAGAASASSASSAVTTASSTTGTGGTGGASVTATGTTSTTGTGGAAPASGTHLASLLVGGPGPQQSKDVAADAQGNVALVGSFSDTLPIGNVTLSADSNDGFLVALDASNVTRWAVALGGAAKSTQTAYAVAIDGAGNVLVAGSSTASADWGGGALASLGSADMVVAKFGPDGKHVWSKQFGGSAFDLPDDIAVDAAGNVFLVGNSGSPTITFGGAALTGSDTDIVVVKLDAGGNHVASARWAADANQDATGVAIDTQGRVIVSGTTRGALDVGGAASPFTPKSAGAPSPFVAKLDADLKGVWLRGFDAASPGATIQSIATGSDDSIVVVGSHEGAVDFGDGAVTPTDADAFVVKLDAAGALAWRRTFGGAGAQLAKAVALDPSNGVVVTGSLDGATDFGGGARTPLGVDAFALKLDEAGAHVFSAIYGDAEEQSGEGVACDAQGDAVLLVDHAGTADYGGGELTSTGQEDSAVVRLAR